MHQSEDNTVNPFKFAWIDVVFFVASYIFIMFMGIKFCGPAESKRHYFVARI